MKLIFIIFFLFFLIVIVIGIWSFFVEPNIIVVEEISIPIKNLPSSFENLKFVQLSDLHSKNFGKKEKKVLKILAKLNPDFVFLTGDFIDWTTKDLESCQEFWQALSKNYPRKVFGVFGNHDHANQKFKALNKLFAKNGIKILNNESVILREKENFIYLLGVDDPNLGYDNFEKAAKDLKKEIPKILLAHSPEIFRKVKDKNVDLVLVGHTHGGQISIPILDSHILPLRYDIKYKKGLFKENSTYLYVNRGIGESILPIRFNSLPEITLIKLTKKL